MKLFMFRVILKLQLLVVNSLNIKTLMLHRNSGECVKREAAILERASLFFQISN